jgi:hypothetical protein
MPAVLEKARQDRADGHLWMARKRLTSYISSTGYDRNVLDLLGDICHQMGDEPAAGRYWFFVELRSPHQQQAVSLFLQQSSRRPELIGLQWPAKLREVRPERLPDDARQRLAAIAHLLPKRKPRPVATHRSFTPRDQLMTAGCMLAALFFVYCFSVGFAQVIGLK